MALTLKPHQIKAINELENGKILYGGTGVGKSITAMAYFFMKVCGGTLGDWGSLKHTMDVYVITTAKKRDDLDWEDEALKVGIGTERDASAGGIKLHVDSWNNIKNYVGVKNAFFIFDEQRIVGSGAWARSFITIAKHNQWILLSATPGDTWLDYIPVFIANGFYKNRTEFKRRHVVYNTYSKFPKVDRYIETGTLVKHRNNLLVHMPYERHTRRLSTDIRVDYDEALFKRVMDDRWHVYEQRPIRDVAELFAVMRKVVNSDSSRLAKLRSLMIKHPKLIVFYNFDYELEQLRTLSSIVSENTQRSLNTTEQNSGTLSIVPRGHWTKDEGKGELWIPNSLSETEEFMKKSRNSLSQSSSKIDTAVSTHTNGMDPSLSQTRLEKDVSVQDASLESPSFSIAEWNGHKHEPIPQTDRWLYLVQYAAGSEGWNCVETDAMVFYSLTYSYKHFHQAHGRIDRLNTPFKDLHYYSLVSDSFIDRAVERSLKSKRSFNESSLRLKVA